MKRYGLLLIIVFPLLGMQQPNQVVEQFYQAIRDGNVVMVQRLVSRPEVQQMIKTHKYFATEAVLKFPPRVPSKTADYMRIARILKNAGALMDERAEVVMVDYEKKHTPAPTPTRPAEPVVTPISKPSRALPATPATAPTPKPVAPSSHKLIPADFNVLMELAYGKFNELKAYLETHDVSILTPKQKSEVIGRPVATLNNLGGETAPELVHALRRTIKLLERNGFKMENYVINAYNRTQKGDFGPRAGSVESLLNIAIKSKDLNRVKHLVEQEDVDVNATDSSVLSPLIIAAKAEAEAIAKYLYSKGARLYETNYYENRQFKPVLQKWGIPVN